MAEHMLPFAQGTQVYTSQGNAGDPGNPPNSSHKLTGKDRYGFDFVPQTANWNALGFPIVAAAGGRVAHLREDSDVGGNDPAFKDQANYLVICHGDGFCDVYVHLQCNSITNIGHLALGDQVARGQPIAGVGSTGWSSAPHLHFQHQQCGAAMCQLPCYASYWQQSVPLVFSDPDVQRTNGLPRRGETYVSANSAASLKNALQALVDQRTSVLLLNEARAFKAYVQAHDLGVPLSSLMRLPGPDGKAYTGPGGQTYLVQVFEADTLYLPLGQANVLSTNDLIRPIVPPLPQPGGEADWWNTALRNMILQLLTPAYELALRLWEHTYRNAGITFHPSNPGWASHWFALGQLGTRPLGAPLGAPPGTGPGNGQCLVTIGGTQYLAEIYAKDTTYWVNSGDLQILRDIRRLSELGG